MASRRTGLFGASEDERESRLNQQRDYAAQLQEQVRIKNARAEQDKARRQQEQQQEREMLDAQQQQQQQQQARRPPQPQLNLQQTAPPQQQQQQQQPPSPVRSPQRNSQPQQQYQQQQYQPQQQQQQQQQYQYQSQEPQVQHGTAMLAGAGSPPKQPWGYTPMATTTTTTTMTSDTMNLLTPNSYASPSLHAAPLVTTFSPGASIFDALLQSPETNNSETTRQIDALRQLRLDTEAYWTQRRLAQQSVVAAKPCFILPPSPTASARVPLSLDEKRLLDDEIDLTPRFQEDEQELLSNNNTGLLGESVLIPLAKAPMRPPSSSSACSSPISSSLPSASPPRTPSAVHRRLAAATAAASSMATYKCSSLDTSSSSSSSLCLDHPNSTALRHDSELLHFDQ